MRLIRIPVPGEIRIALFVGLIAPGRVEVQHAFLRVRRLPRLLSRHAAPCMDEIRA
jgi:hypothetical protein